MKITTTEKKDLGDQKEMETLEIRALMSAKETKLMAIPSKLMAIHKKKLQNLDQTY